MKNDERTALRIGNHKAYLKGYRIIKRIENEVTVVRVETSFHVPGYGTYSHYTAPVLEQTVKEKKSC